MRSDWSMAAAAIAWFVKRRVRKVFAVVLHLSFIVILAGALLTHLTARRGMIHLHKGETINYYLEQEGNDIKTRVLALPMSVNTSFSVKYARKAFIFVRPAAYQNLLLLRNKLLFGTTVFA